MVIVLDTNVLISGMIKAYSKPAKIVRIVASGEIRIAYDARIISEYKNVLSRKKLGILPADRDNIILQITKEGELVKPVLYDTEMIDQDDRPFVEVVIGSSSNIIVTGNCKHYPQTLAEKGINVLTPHEFLDTLAT